MKACAEESVLQFNYLSKPEEAKPNGEKYAVLPRYILQHDRGTTDIRLEIQAHPVFWKASPGVCILSKPRDNASMDISVYLIFHLH